MDSIRIQELVAGHKAGSLSAKEIKELELLIETGEVKLEDLESLHALDERIMNLSSPLPSMNLDATFHQMLSAEKQKSTTAFSWKKFFSWPELAPKLAFASVTLILGLAAGYYVRPAGSSTSEIKVLTDQVSDLKEMMMLTLLEKESATERLKAVSLTEGMDQASQKVTTALIETLNNDENINVRLAALEALRPYTKDDKVRTALIKSIGQQKSPLVQVALAELMAELQVKSSVKEWKKLLDDQKTPPEIRKKIQETIQVLI